MKPSPAPQSACQGLSYGQGRVVSQGLTGCQSRAEGRTRMAGHAPALCCSRAWELWRRASTRRLFSHCLLTAFSNSVILIALVLGAALGCG